MIPVFGSPSTLFFSMNVVSFSPMSAIKPEIPVIFLAYANEKTEHGFLRNLTGELKSIMNALEPSVQRGRVQLKITPAASAEEIRRAFQDEWYEQRISIFHYGGHADEDDLWLENGEGGNKSFFSVGLSRFLGSQQGIKLVFLNGCATKAHADLLLAAGIPAVIATARKIDDYQATRFATVFYHGLASGASIGDAFGEAEGIMLGEFGESGSHRSSFFWEDLEATQAEGHPWRLFTREETGWFPKQWQLFYEKKAPSGQASLSADMFIGETINNYKILQILGDGAMGTVFKALHVNLNQEVALKITHRAIEGYDLLKKIIFEGNKGLASIKHPNVVDFLDVGEMTLFGQKRLYIVMELVKGDRLDQVDFGISMMRPGDFNRLADFALEVCAGLEAAHNTSFIDEAGQAREGIIHGNIMTRKILLTIDQVPKLIDFMFADIERSSNIKLDVPEAVTLRAREERLDAYLPPEVVSGKRPITKQTDLYSLGAVFFEVFAGKTLAQVSLRTEEDMHRFLTRRNRYFPRKYSKVIFTATHPDPEQRFQTVREMIQAIVGKASLMTRISYWFKGK